MQSEEREDQLAADATRAMHAGDFAVARAAFAAAAEIARERGDESAESIHTANLGMACLQLRRFDEAAVCFERALPVIAAQGRHQEIQIRRSLAIAYLEQTQREKAREQLEMALEAARSLDDTDMVPELLGYLGITETTSGRHHEATALYERAVAAARDIGDEKNAARWEAALETSRRRVAELDDPPLAAAGDYDRALRAARATALSPHEQIELWLTAARSCRLARDYEHLADSLANAALLLSGVRRYDEADTYFADALDVLRPLGDERRIGLVEMNQAVSLRDRGETGRAVELLERAVERLRGAAHISAVAHALQLLADVHAMSGAPDRAFPILEELERIFRDTRDSAGLANILLRRGALDSAVDAAEPLYREAIALAENGSHTETLVLAAMGLAQLLVAQERRPEALREMRRLRDRVRSQAPKHLAVAYFFELAQITGIDDDDAFDVWTEAHAMAEQAGDPVTVTRALGGICTIDVRRLMALRARLNPTRAAAQLRPVSDEDEAIELIQSVLAARENLGQAILENEGRFNQIVFDSLAFNIHHALTAGEDDRAQGLAGLARFIVQSIEQSLRITAGLVEQLVERDETEIIYFEPGATVRPIADRPDFTRRAAEELMRDGHRLMAAQRFAEASARLANAEELFGSVLDVSSAAQCFANLAFCASSAGDFEGALRHAQRALEHFRGVSDHASVARVLQLAGGALFKLGQVDVAMRTYEEAYETARATEARDVEASAAANLGAVFQETGDLRAALLWLERGLALKRESSDPQALIGTLNNLASLYRDLGDISKSDAAIAEVRALLESAANPRELAGFLNNRAAEALQARNVAEAETLLWEAVAAASAAADPVLEFQVLTSLVVALRAQSKWDAVEAQLSRAEEIQKRLGDPRRHATLLRMRMDIAAMRGDWIAVVAASEQLLRDHAETLTRVEDISLLMNAWNAYHTLGRLSEMEATQNRLLRTVEDHLANPGPEDLALFVRCVRVYATLGMHGVVDRLRAIALLDEASGHMEAAGDMEEIIELTEQMASLQRSVGQLPDAVSSHERALALTDAHGTPWQKAVILTNLGTALREFGDLQRSAATFDQALRVMRPLGAVTLQIQTLLKYAGVAYDLGRIELRRRLTEEAAALARQTGDRPGLARAMIAMASDHLAKHDGVAAEREIRTLMDDPAGISEDIMAEALGVLALALREQERYPEAIAYADQAIPLRKASAIEDATTLFYAGILYRENGDAEAALRRFDQALSAAAAHAVSPLVVNIRQSRGDVYRSRGDLASAEREYELALGVVNALWKRAPDEQDRIGRLSEFAFVAEKLAGVLLRQGKTAKAFAALEASKARAFVDRLGLGQLPVPAAVPGELLNRERKCLDAVRLLNQQSAMRAAAREEIDAAYVRVSTEYDEVLREMSAYAPAYVEWRRGSTVTYDDVREMLRT